MESKAAIAAQARPAEDWTVISDDGTILACRTVGSGDPVVVVHGSLAVGAAWQHVAELLADQYRVTVFDRRGRGGSGDADDYSIEREIQDVRAVLAAVGDRPVLIGHSFGGAVAAEVARGAELGALVLYEPGLRLDGPVGGPTVGIMERALVDGDFERVLETGWREVVGVPDRAIRAAHASPTWGDQLALVDTWPRELRALDTLAVVPADFADIRVPTLVLRGTESAAWLRHSSEQIAGLIPAGSLVELEGQGHDAGAAAPGMVADSVRSFVEVSSKIRDPDAAASVVRLRSDTAWNGTRYESYPAGRPQLTVVRYSIPPHSSLPWHRHDAPNTAFVISGSITLQSIAGVEHVFRAGDAFAESVGDEHRGFTGDERAEIVCTYAGAAGVPLSVPTGRDTAGS
ncbi:MULTISPECIES: alpha/beta fold hydrolase [unclassified Curtobacterium]|uniref:alpha/beta fold hydrolase n=1 Tax=unclassified Curtobacterium TaxID=257496 RepID=UPI000DA98139|nr:MULTISPECIES: alpha/beta fold hydrolase [unclassified Curtobacterium]QZQ53848.1 alpha/beta fold hydrolase [Curtobacterium sp. TC1]WIE70412.1 alpha/beta fold hydrolase [Curtobacterium sp. MCJR17_020]